MIKHLALAAFLAALALPASAQVGLSLSIGDPGFYGQINIGGAPVPQLIYPQPVVIAPAPQFYGAPPIYLRVPPGHAKHWSKHCAAYNACGRPVYFVKDDWYTNRYVPYYRSQHPHYEGGNHADNRGHGNPGHDMDYRKGHGQKFDRGNGHGKGHSKGHGNRENRQ